MYPDGVCEAMSDAASSRNRPAVSLKRRPTIAWAGTPFRRNATPGAQAYADEGRGRLEPSFVWPHERSAEHRSLGLALLQLDGDRRGAVRHDAERRASLRRDDPETSDVGVQRRRGFVEPDLRAMHECADDAHPSIRW
jgi:hypothetical protein